MSEPKYAVVIAQLTENPEKVMGFFRTKGNNEIEHASVTEACDLWGRERIANALLAALEQVRSHAAK